MRNETLSSSKPLNLDLFAHSPSEQRSRVLVHTIGRRPLVARHDQIAVKLHYPGCAFESELNSITGAAKGAIKTTQRLKDEDRSA